MLWCIWVTWVLPGHPTPERGLGHEPLFWSSTDSSESPKPCPGSATGREIGFDHAHLARLIKAGRLSRGTDGLVDVAEAHAVTAQSDPAMRRKPVQQRSDRPVTQGAESPLGHRSESPAPVTTPDDARAAVRLIEQVLADEGVASTGPVDFPATSLAETILKARDRSLRIAERRKALVPIAAVKGRIASTFVALRRQIQQMPARHVAEMAAKLGCDAGALHGELDRMIHDTLSEMSAPTNADELTMELDDSDGQIELPRMGATVTAALGWDDTGAVVPFAGTVDTASSNGEGKKHGHHGGGHHSGSTSTYVPATSGSVAGSQHSAGGRGKGRTLTISAKSADMTGKLKEQRSAHMDNATFGDVAQAWGEKAGLTVKVDSALSSVNRPYWSMARESFMTWGERMAQQLDATFTIYNGTAAFTPRAGGSSASGQSLTSIDVAWGIDLSEWSIAPVLSRPDDGTFQTRWYDVVAATHEVETADGTTGKSPATHSHRVSAPDGDQAKAQSGSNKTESGREKGSGSVTIDGEPNAIAGALANVSGIRDGVDGTDLISGVTHSRSRHSGVITLLEPKQPAGAAGTDRSVGSAKAA